MVLRMLLGIEDFEVLDPVIVSVPVLVVYQFTTTQIPSKMLFHYITMLQNRLSLDFQFLVSRLHTSFLPALLSVSGLSQPFLEDLGLSFRGKSYCVAYSPSWGDFGVSPGCLKAQRPAPGSTEQMQHGKLSFHFSPSLLVA